MNSWRMFLSTAVSRSILGIAAYLVPRRDRDEWWTEWTSELWYLSNANRQQDRFSPDSDRGVTRFCLGAFPDAVWLRLNGPRPKIAGLFSFRSAIQCLAFLALLSASSIYFAFHSPGVRDMIRQQPVPAHFFWVALALLILPSTTGLAMGEYRASADSGSRVQRLRQWTFLAVKVALILPAVFFGTLDLAPLISRGGLQPHAAVVGYVLSFRWALKDQRRRCPVCLRRLGNPIRIGQPSHVFLEWYGTEFMCPQGHGLLYVPDMPTISYRTHRWLFLGPSWRSLFS